MGTLAVRLLTEEYLLAVYSLLVANLTPDCTACISQGMTGMQKEQILKRMILRLLALLAEGLVEVKEGSYQRRQN